MYEQLSRRERQIMDALHRLGEAGASEIAAELPDVPGSETVRVTLTILERKGVVSHRREGRRYLYVPKASQVRMKRQAALHLLRTFFRGSPAQAVLTLLDASRHSLSQQELDAISAWIDQEKARSRRRS